MNITKEDSGKTLVIELSPILVIVLIAASFLAGMFCQGYYDLERGLTTSELSAPAPKYDESWETDEEDSGIVTDEDGTPLNDEPSRCGISV